jgi:hypothetical protein
MQRSLNENNILAQRRKGAKKSLRNAVALCAFAPLRERFVSVELLFAQSPFHENKTAGGFEAFSETETPSHRQPNPPKNYTSTFCGSKDYGLDSCARGRFSYGQPCGSYMPKSDLLAFSTNGWAYLMKWGGTNWQYVWGNDGVSKLASWNMHADDRFVVLHYAALCRE